MKSRIALCVALALVCLTAVAGQPQDAGAQLQPSADGKLLERKARLALNALVSMEPEQLWKQLAPWRQSSVALHKARIVKALELEKMTWEDLQQEFAVWDPAGLVTPASVEEFRNLPEHDFMALTAGLYRMAADKAATDALGGLWFSVNRTMGVGQLIPRRAAEMGMELQLLLQTVGTVEYESVDGARVTVLCVAHGEEWHATRISWRLSPKEHGSTDAAMASEGLFAGGVSALSGGPGEQECKHILSAMRNMVRVHYSRHGSAPQTLRDAQVDEEQRKASHHTVEDKVWSDGKVCVVVAHPNRKGGRSVLIAFNLTDGKSAHYVESSRDEATKKADKIIADGKFDEKPFDDDPVYYPEPG